jgi:hypothetical protein
VMDEKIWYEGGSMTKIGEGNRYDGQTNVV